MDLQETPLQPQPSPPPPPPPPVRKKEVVLDANGPADAATFAEALEKVENGGVIRVRSGSYHEPMKIDRSITVVGNPDPHFQPIFDGLEVTGNGAVRLEGLGFQGMDGRTPVSVRSASVSFFGCQILNSSAGGDPHVMSAALYISGGRVEIDGGRIGPGGDAALIVVGNSTVYVKDAVLVGGTGYGLYATGRAFLSIGGSSLQGRNAVLASDRATLYLEESDPSAPPGQYVLVFRDRVMIQLLKNRIWTTTARGRRVPAQHGWIQLAPTVTVRAAEGNRAGKRILSLPKGAGPRR